MLFPFFSAVSSYRKLTAERGAFSESLDFVSEIPKYPVYLINII
jgi:hypothetical protein